MVVFRGANDFMCDEMERAVHDSLCVVKRVIESGTVVPGGGAVEAALSIYLENFAHSMVCIATLTRLRAHVFGLTRPCSPQESRNQLAVKAFADAMNVIPKQLTVNAAKDSVDLVSKLRAFHNTAQTDKSQAHLKWYASIILFPPFILLNPSHPLVSRTGLDLVKGTLRDNVQAGIVEPGMSKIKCIKFATEAAITILRIDESIKIVPAPSAEDEQAYQRAMQSGQLNG